MTDTIPPCGGYSAGHPWYYFLGGKVPTLKQIRATAHARGDDYRGYRADEIDKAHLRAEPMRTNDLCKIRDEVLGGLCADISRYREVVRELHAYRAQHQYDESSMSCDGVHTSMSLKLAHIYNGFAHLKTLDALPIQSDLFDFL